MPGCAPRLRRTRSMRGSVLGSGNRCIRPKPWFRCSPRPSCGGRSPAPRLSADSVGWMDAPTSWWTLYALLQASAADRMGTCATTRGLGETLAVLDRDVLVRAKPTATSPVIDTLSFEAVTRWREGHTGSVAAPGWEPIAHCSKSNRLPGSLRAARWAVVAASIRSGRLARLQMTGISPGIRTTMAAIGG